MQGHFKNHYGLGSKKKSFIFTLGVCEAKLLWFVSLFCNTLSLNVSMHNAHCHNSLRTTTYLTGYHVNIMFTKEDYFRSIYAILVAILKVALVNPACLMD